MGENFGGRTLVELLCVTPVLLAVVAFCVGRFLPPVSPWIQVVLVFILMALVAFCAWYSLQFWRRLKRVNGSSVLARAFLSVASEVDEVLIVDEAMNLVRAKPWARQQGEASTFSFDKIIRASFADHDGALEACRKALQQGLYFEDVFEALKKNAWDAECFIRIRILPLFVFSSSRPAYRAIIMSDVTLYHLRTMEESKALVALHPAPALEAKEPLQKMPALIALLDRAFDKVPFGLALINAQGVLTNVNTTLEHWLGAASKKALIGRSFLGLSEESLTMKTLLEGTLKRVSSSGEAAGGRSDPSVGRVLRLRVNRLDPALEAFLFVTPLDEDHIVLTFFKRSLEQGKDFLDYLPFPSLLVDARGVTQAFNARLTTLFQRKKEALPKVGQPLVELLEGSSQAAWKELFRLPSAGAASKGFFELRFANTDLSALGAIKRLDRDQLLVQLIDTSEQKKLEQQFFQAQKNQAIGQLAGGIAHDFNNLLTAIIGFCDLLLQRVMPNDPSFSDIMHIKQNANRASNLVKQLLAFSRRQTLQPRKIDVTETLGDLSVLLRRLIGTPINLRLIRNRETWPIKVDVGQFEQVIINLAVNARDAMEKGGDLTIETSNVTNAIPRIMGNDTLGVGDYVLISVKDTGTGIPEDLVKMIFEPFFSTKPQGKGTGLGLATVYGIVHQTGGVIAVESQMGHGTTFKVFLPRCLDKEEKQAEAKPLVQDITGNETILLVEDEATVRLFAGRALRDKGYRVIEAANGKAALALIQEGTRPDIVLTDVSMPEMTGPAMADKIREILPHVPIVFMSGYAAETFRKDLSENRSMHFLSKPFTLRDLAMTVREILGSKENKK